MPRLVDADPKAAPCYRLDLQDPPRWILSGAAWDRENERLLMVDPTSDQVFSYNLLGERETISSLGRDLRPVKIARSNDGFLLELADGSMLGLNPRFAVTSRISPTNKTSLYQWAAATQGTFAAFAAVVQEKVQYGFFSIQSNSRLQLLLPADEHQKDFFLLGYPYIAAMEDSIYFLSMATHPALYRVSDGKAEKLDALPRQYATRPDFSSPRVTGPSSAVARYAELETLSIPAGLYAQDGYLYLLTREPAGQGKTTWWFYQIDPTGEEGEERIMGRVRLPTNAPHLTVIPTPDRGWLLIEKGKVELDSTRTLPVQKQRVGSVVVVANSAIRSLATPTSCPEGGGILWADETHSRALFIPEKLLASKLLLPVELSAQKHLDLRLAEKRQSASPCDSLESSPGQGTLPDAGTFSDLVAASPIALVGKVVSTEPGWDARERHVVTKVNVEVQRPLKGTLKAGSTIDFLSPGGNMLLAGKSVCTSPRRGFYQPRVGDQIVVSAELSVSDSRLLEAPYVFPLVRGEVQPEPYPALSAKQKPQSLTKLLDSSSNGTF
jgi:hypothetical protein